MAVPKKRTSKARTSTRKAVWKAEARKASQKSLSLAKSILKNKATSFIYKEGLEAEEELETKENK
jgi:large subunit ribosomal protein L32